MMIVMPPMMAMKFMPPSPMEKPSKNTRVQAGGEVHAGDDHGGGVDERGDRRGAGHGVGQPRVQRELAALADHADEAGTSAPTSSSVCVGALLSV